MKNIHLRLFVLICLMCSLTGLGAQVRSMVPVVRPQFSKEIRSFYNEVADYYQHHNAQYADWVRGHLDKTFGSGFLVHDLDGVPVVLTNFHVVELAQSAILEFRLTDNAEATIIKDCPILYRDDDVDMAIIGLPAGNSQGITADSPFLAVSDGSVKDGQEVWAAGYPGLRAKPAWQLTKGNVSNSNMIMKELALGEGQRFIQHTAPIDPGSSGGPLLAGDISDEKSFRVVGINARKNTGRDSFNLAVPVDIIRQVLKEYDDLQDPQKAEALVQKKINQFVAAVNNKDIAILEGRRYISDWLLARKGWSNFKDGFESWTDKQKKAIFDDQHYFSPSDGIRAGIYMRYHYFFVRGNLDMKLSGLTYLEDSGQEFFRAELTKAGRTFVVDWQLESGTWKIIGGKVPEINLWSSYEKKPVTKGFGQSEGTDTSQAIPALVPKKQMAVQGEKLVFTNAPSGFLVSAGLSSTPLWYAYSYAPSVYLGYMYSPVPWFSCGGTADLSWGSSLVTDFAQDNLGYIEGTAFAHFNLAYPEDVFLNNGILPYLSLAASAGAAVYLGEDTTVTRDTAFSFAFRPGAGFKILLEKNLSVGFETTPRFSWYDSAWPRLNSIDMSVFATF